ncbi:mitochondrial matrix Mmp37 [Sistotremastrum suecicum HHB10207 ss-3]|nr:mitochondrial matrix Mmp37 [Sistotremastrum suecicum HHB10207 ss-3]
MLDFIFAVNHPAHWHSINLSQHPSHYAFHNRLFGSDFVTRIQRISPGVWFNAYVPMNGVTIKYGVTTLDNLCSDLLSWRSLYLAGRMHKPIRIIKDDARVRLTQQVNLTSALRTALLTLPEEFEERDLFERISGISYGGDPRMWLPAENRAKIRNIVSTQSPQFRELYRRLAVGLPGVHWPMHSSAIKQDMSPTARSNHLRKLPSRLLGGVNERYSVASSHASREADESAYYLQMAGYPDLSSYIEGELKNIVRGPATSQSIKGIISAGLGQSIRYSASKVGKWWRGGP